MNSFYFTYGTEKQYPFQGGWTLVFADSFDIALMVFDAYHPRQENGCINYALMYNEDEFYKSGMAEKGNFGAKCHEIIKVSRIPLTKKGEQK